MNFKTALLLAAALPFVAQAAEEQNASDCQSLRAQVRQIEQAQKQPKNPQMQDYIKEQKRKAQDQMRQLSCREMD